jgi:hypothetical protein
MWHFVDSLYDKLKPCVFHTYVNVHVEGLVDVHLEITSREIPSRYPCGDQSSAFVII